MARSSTDLPRMQNQARTRAPLERGRKIVAQAIENATKPKRPPRPQMMRQYDLIERVRRYNPNTNEPLLNRAYVYAMKAHGEQKRASGDPYFSHPLEVAAILTDLKLDDATIAAALLHDTIEDTHATRAEIDELFGEDIGGLVEGLTKLAKLDLVTKEAKQAENLRKLLLAIADDVRVLLVKLADRLHNMRTLGHMPPEARRRTAEETIDIYAPLAGRMGMHELREELEDLAFRELNPDAYRGGQRAPGRVGRAQRRAVAEIEQQLTRKLGDRGIVAEVKGRRKRAYSIWRKMERKSVGFEQLSDIVGFRVVVKTIAECYQALGIVHTTWPMVPARFKDYVSTPKQNDYRSIHTTVIGPGKQRVELQIRTARYGRDRRIRHRRARALQGRRRLADRDAVAGIERLCLAAADHRAAGGRLQLGRVPRAHQARAVPRSGVLLHAQGQADRAAALGQRHRLRLCGAHRRRQHRGRRQDQRQDRAAGLGARQRRRGRDHHLEGADRAAGGLGIAGQDRQGARRHPACNPRRGACAICRARPPHRRAAVPARQDRLFRREAAGRAAAAGARHRSTRCSRPSAAARCAPPTSRAPCIPTTRRSARPPSSSRPSSAAAGSASGAAKGVKYQAPGGNEQGAIPIRGINGDLPVRFAPNGGAVPGDRIVGILTPGEGITIYPIQSPSLKDFEDVPERWIDLRWDIDERAPQRFPARIQIKTVNEPGSLAQVAQVIAEHDGNIDNIRMERQAPDFTSVTIDLEVYDLKHLTSIIAQLRAKDVVAAAERVNA